MVIHTVELASGQMGVGQNPSRTKKNPHFIKLAVLYIYLSL